MRTCKHSQCVWCILLEYIHTQAHTLSTYTCMGLLCGANPLQIHIHWKVFFYTRTCMYMCVYMQLYLYKHTYTYIHECVSSVFERPSHINVHGEVRMHFRFYTITYMYVCTCVCIQTHVYTYINTYLHASPMWFNVLRTSMSS